MIRDQALDTFPGVRISEHVYISQTLACTQEGVPPLLQQAPAHAFNQRHLAPAHPCILLQPREHIPGACTHRLTSIVALIFICIFSPAALSMQIILGEGDAVLGTSAKEQADLEALPRVPQNGV